MAISEGMADRADRTVKHQREKTVDEIDAERAEAKAKLDAMRASAQEVAIRRQAHDMVAPHACVFPCLPTIPMLCAVFTPFLQHFRAHRRAQERATCCDG